MEDHKNKEVGNEFRQKNESTPRCDTESAAGWAGDDRQLSGGQVQSIERHDHKRHRGDQTDGLSRSGLVHASGRRYVPGSIRAAEIPDEIVAEYTCSICGITIREHKNWGPHCRKTGRRVCDICCFECEHNFKSSGLWRCAYESEEDRRKAVKQRIQQRLEDENLKASQAYHAKRKEEARQWAIRKAKATKKAKQNPGGRY